MIANIVFSVVLFQAIIATTSSADLNVLKKVLTRPLYDMPLVENQNSVPKLTVSIYYGSMCSDCVDFFRNQIGPNSTKFQKYVNFDFVPFGKTETKLFDGRWFFKCQNGLNECMKNKWQACSIHVLPSKLPLLTNYLVCNMISTEGDQSGYKCTRRLGLYDDYYGKIKKCLMNREFSDTLMIRHGNRTQALSPRPTRMPTIAFNGVYNESEQDNARKDLRRVICEYLHPKPTEIC